jgi:hypothetical protein
VNYVEKTGTFYFKVVSSAIIKVAFKRKKVLVVNWLLNGQNSKYLAQTGHFTKLSLILNQLQSKIYAKKILGKISSNKENCVISMKKTLTTPCKNCWSGDQPWTSKSHMCPGQLSTISLHAATHQIFSVALTLTGRFFIMVQSPDTTLPDFVKIWLKCSLLCPDNESHV